MIHTAESAARPTFNDVTQLSTSTQTSAARHSSASPIERSHQDRGRATTVPVYEPPRGPERQIVILAVLAKRRRVVHDKTSARPFPRRLDRESCHVRSPLPVVGRPVVVRRTLRFAHRCG